MFYWLTLKNTFCVINPSQTHTEKGSLFQHTMHDYDMYLIILYCFKWGFDSQGDFGA